MQRFIKQSSDRFDLDHTVALEHQERPHRDLAIQRGRADRNPAVALEDVPVETDKQRPKSEALN